MIHAETSFDRVRRRPKVMGVAIDRSGSVTCGIGSPQFGNAPGISDEPPPFRTPACMTRAGRWDRPTTEGPFRQHAPVSQAEDYIDCRDFRRPFTPAPSEYQAPHTSPAGILQDEQQLDQQSPIHFSPCWIPTEFHNQPSTSPEWIDKLTREHHFHHCSDDLDDLAFRAQKKNDHPWDPNASTYYSVDSEDNDGNEPCRKGGPTLKRKEKSARAREPLHRKEKPPPRSEGKKTKGGRKLRGQWSDEALKAAIEAIDASYKWEEVCSHYGIHRTSLRNHISGRTR